MEMDQTDAPLGRSREGFSFRKAGYPPAADRRADNAAPNSCANCKFEEACGYSPLAMSLARPKRRSAGSFEPCPLGFMSPRGNKEPQPFFRPKGFEFTPDEEMRLEAAHRVTAPRVEWNHIVRLPFGCFDRVNRSRFDSAVAAEHPNQFIQLASMSWELVSDLVVIESDVRQ